jgi:zeaxanthin glucosyltransferase
VDNLLELIRKVLTNRSYAERANYFKEVIAKTRGLDRAAEIIEQSVNQASAKK